MIKLDGLSHTGFDVEDLDRCERFYVDVLGAKVEWKRDNGVNRLMKLYIGSLGLSIPERPKGAPKPDVPFAIHFAFKANPDHVDEYIAHIKAQGVEVDGPIGHPREHQNVSWFFSDPDGYRLEVEAHYATTEQALSVVEGRTHERQQELALFRGDGSPEALREGIARS